MEPITQGLLGAATGYAVAGDRLGRQSLLWGALIGMSPDIDVLLGPLHRGFGEWIYHRGATHSLWFGFVFGPLLGALLWRWRDPEQKTARSAWMALAVVALVTHPLLDGFTPYGTQFFAPFSRERFAWNGVAIVDPFYSVILVVGVLFAALAKNASSTRTKQMILATLGLSTFYLLMGLGANQAALADLKAAFAKRNIPVDRVRAYPTIFQPWLRHFVVHSGNDRLVGFHSLFEMGCPVWQRRTRPATDTRLRRLQATWEGETLAWFADGDLGFEERRIPGGYLTRIDDLRYAWSSADAHGMWGIEARFDLENQMVGSVERFASRNPSEEDMAHAFSALRGQLPLPKNGWRRPALCQDVALGFR